MSSAYPGEWRQPTHEQRARLANSDRHCVLAYHGCTGHATTTVEVITGEPVSDQTIACQTCADQRRHP